MQPVCIGYPFFSKSLMIFFLIEPLSLLLSKFLVSISEVVVRRCSVEKMFFEFSQNSQENTCMPGSLF